MGRYKMTYLTEKILTLSTLLNLYLQERIREAWDHRAGHRLVAFGPTDWAQGRHSETKSPIKHERTVTFLE